MSFSQMTRLSNKLGSYLQLVLSGLAGRLQSTPVSLHWGSHRTELGLAQFIIDFVIEESPAFTSSVTDPLIEGFTHRHAFSDRAICRLRDATFDPDSGYIFCGRQIVIESHSSQLVSHVRKINRTRRITTRPVIGVATQTHYHWLIETLPRVIAASRYAPNALLVAPTTMPRTQREAIEMLGLDVCYSDERFLCDELVLATRGIDSGWAHPVDVALLRMTFSVPNELGTHQIFVSRAGSRRGDVLSQKIDQYAEQQGWWVIRAEHLNWSDHLSIFGKTAVIAGEHGAGLANIALSPGNARLIELVRANCANPCYVSLSAIINHDQGFHSAEPISDFNAALRII